MLFALAFSLCIVVPFVNWFYDSFIAYQPKIGCNRTEEDDLNDSY